MQKASQTDGRRLHYGQFYGLLPVRSDAPLAVVVGNCQAESLRIMLDGPDLSTVRIPPVFELTADDLPHLAHLLARTRVLVSQPVRDDYHDLPLGTSQLAALLPAGARVVRIPVVRFAGLYPFQVIVRPPFDTSLVPPLVEYHDLRTVVRAWRRHRGLQVGVDAPGTDARIREVAAQSVAELRRRERHHDTVIVSDLFSQPTFDLMRTINHPGNAIWAAAAARVRSRLGLAEHLVDPGRELLNAVHAPREPLVIDAFGLDDDPRAEWIVGERVVDAAEVERTHAEWYDEHPSVVDAALARHAATLEALGLSAAVTAPSGEPALRRRAAGTTPAGAAATGTAPSGAARADTAPTGAAPAGTAPAGSAALPRQLVIGSRRHAVSACADALAGSTARLTPGAEASAALRVYDLLGLLEAASGILNLHVQFTDRLFGSTPETAADLFEALAEGRRLTVTLHDLPQPSDGERNLPRRAAAYRRVAEAASGVVCNSRHEALLLAEYTRPRLRTEVAVIPLPVEQADAPAGVEATSQLSSDGLVHSRNPTRREAAVLGYFYPGKGHADVIAAVAGSRSGPVAGLSVVALGAAAPGHEAELGETAAAAAAVGVTFEATGYLDDDALLERCRSAAVPVAAHQHLSASASINTWIAAGRRPLLPAGRYTREIAELRPATVTLYEPGELADALEHALAHPESTWIAPGTSIRPDLSDTARQYLAWWGSL